MIISSTNNCVYTIFISTYKYTWSNNIKPFAVNAYNWKYVHTQWMIYSYYACVYGYNTRIRCLNKDVGRGLYRCKRSTSKWELYRESSTPFMHAGMILDKDNERFRRKTSWQLKQRKHYMEYRPKENWSDKQRTCCRLTKTSFIQDISKAPLLVHYFS